MEAICTLSAEVLYVQSLAHGSVEIHLLEAFQQSRIIFSVKQLRRCLQPKMELSELSPVVVVAIPIPVK